MIYADMKDSNAQSEIDEQLKATEDKKWYRRLMIISLSAKRHTVKKLTEMFQLSEATIRRYIHAYNQDGLSGLRPKRATGRPSKIAHWTKVSWDRVLQKTPNQYEKLNTCSPQWTLLRLAKSDGDRGGNTMKSPALLRIEFCVARTNTYYFILNTCFWRGQPMDKFKFQKFTNFFETCLT